MEFSSLVAGCRFDKKNRGERELFRGAGLAALPGEGAEPLGDLDFFSAPSPAAPPPAAAAAKSADAAAADAPARGASRNARRRKNKAAAAPADAAAPAASSAAPTSEREVAEANALRKALRIHVYGEGVPPPVQSAEQMAARLELRPQLLRAVLSAGYHELTRVQMQAVPTLVARRELLAIAPTGSGKTAAFAIPLLALLGSGKGRGGLRAVVVAPTQELARQTHREILKLGAGSKLNVGVLSKKLAAAAADAAAGGGGLKRYDALVATPLRLVSLLRKGALKLGAVELLVLDEADRLLDGGFLPQIDEVLAACDGERVTRALFSATVPPAVEDLATSTLRRPVRLVVGEKNAATETISQKLVFCGREDGKLLALKELVRVGIKPPVLIFVQSKERASELYDELAYDGLNVDVIHAERPQAQRDAVVEQFRTGKVWVLIATELMARGMDFKGVSLVVNYDFPTSVSSYVHRIGRTGRAGRAGEAVTFFTEGDVEQLRAIANVMKASGCEVPEWMLKLKPLKKAKRRRLEAQPRARKAIRKRRDELEAGA